MTAAHLARIAAAIEQDAATEAANWPLSRERTRLYLMFARAAVAKASMVPAADYSNIYACFDADVEYDDALAALAPEEVPDA